MRGISKFLAIAILMLLAVAMAVMGAATIESPSSNQEICGLTGFNVSVVNMTIGLDPVLLTCYIDSTLVINVTNGTGFANITSSIISTTTWIATPSDVEGGTLNCTAYGAGYLNNKLNLIVALDESDSNIVSIDNTAPTFTFTPADGTVVEEGTQTITATSTDKLSSRGFSFDGTGRETTLASDSYSFTYDVNSDDYADGIIPYSAVGVDNASCSNSRTSAVKYLEVDHKGNILPLILEQQGQAQAIASAQAKQAFDIKNLGYFAIIAVVVYLVFLRKK